MVGTFKQYGRTYHLLIRGAEDLDAVLALDDALWVATGAPVDSVRCDPVFLELLDLDSNGRIMCFEVRSAIRWLREHLTSLEGFDRGSSTLELARIRRDGPEGGRILGAAEKIADRFGGTDSVTLERIRTVKSEASARPVSEHGVVLPEAADEEDVRKLIQDLLATVGGVPHPGGASGITDRALDAFIEAAQSYLAWAERGIHPLGDATADASRIVDELEGKIDQYFALQSALAVDSRVAQRFRLRDDELAALDTDDVDALRSVLARAPIADPVADKPLPLDDRTNPYYRTCILGLKQKVVTPILGSGIEELTATQWEEIRRYLAPYRKWLQAKPDTPVSKIPAETLRAHLNSDAIDRIRRLIDHAEETAILVENVRLVEKLALYQGFLLRFLNNFVSFPQLYDRNARALFEMGTLTMDGRHFTFAVKVTNRAAHRAVAATSSMFVLYVRVQAKVGVSEYEVAVPVTDGGVKNLAIGKRGLFRDVAGTELDAEVVDMIQNPISVVETIAAPFKRIGDLVTKKIETLTAEAQARLDTRATQAVPVPSTSLPGAGVPAPIPLTASAPASGPVGSGGGIIAGSGVAIAAVGTAFTYFASTITSLSLWRVVVGIASAVAAVIIPMTVLALLKLRRRDVSAILEGSGWAVNLRMRLSRGQATFFTQAPHLPLRSRRLTMRRIVWTVVSLLLAAALAALYWYVLPMLAQ